MGKSSPCPARSSLMSFWIILFLFNSLSGFHMG